MPTLVRPQPGVADVVALVRALERDEQRAADELRVRDSRIAPGLPPGKAEPLAVVLGWLEGVKGEDEAVRSLHQRAETAVHLTGFFIALAGALLGWGATLAAFYFDGSGRVNAVAVLALLVALPGVLLLPFLLAALPSRAVRRIPGVGVLAAIARALTPGRLAPLLWRVYPRDLRDALALVSGRLEKQRALYSTLQKWALLRWSQLFAVAFQITAVVAGLVLVVFTDLAFGWSTTLTTGDAAIDVRRVHRITSSLAAPWAWALEDARPTLALIEESRYYRVASESVSRAEAARLGGWWKFVTLTIAVYGLLPRVLTLAFARARLRAAARAAVLEAPGVSGLLRRIHRAQIDTRAIESEPEPSGAPPSEPAAQPSLTLSGSLRAIINWSGVPVGPEVLAANFPAAPVFPAGGAATVQDDGALAEQLGATKDNGGGDVLIVVKAWEPPLLDFTDFVKTLRGALARESMIVVLPVGLDAAGGLSPASPAQVKLWRDKLARLGDPWLRVTASREQVHS